MLTANQESRPRSTVLSNVTVSVENVVKRNVSRLKRHSSLHWSPNVSSKWFAAWIFSEMETIRSLSMLVDIW
ncbi:hypothetical protein BVRB_020310, partial [Beta vulgaris subsp. vulgaris]